MRVSSSVVGLQRWVSTTFAAQLSDGEATLRVALSAGGLVVLGVVLLVATLRWWRSTRPEAPVLGPLTVMDGRNFRSADPEVRRRLLESAREHQSTDDS